jgi:hypothetical protein
VRAVRTSLLLLSLVAVVSSCHKSPGSPTTPTPNTPSAPTVTGLSVSPLPDLLRISATQQLTATATLSNGTSSVVQATWSTDAPTIVAVSNGLIAGLTPGQADVFADYQGQRATGVVRIVPDYAGPWRGAFFIKDCQLTGDWTRTTACEGEVSSTNWRLTLSATQDRASVSGTVVAIVDMPVTTTGSLALDGALTLSGSSPARLNGDDWTVQVVDWQTRTVNSNEVRGTFTFIYGLRQYQGGVQWTCEIPYLDRSSSLARSTLLRPSKPTPRRPNP